jgi:serine/threonine protein kinase
LYEKIGTLAYLAPEVLISNKHAELYYTEKCDMWSIGIISYLLLTGKMAIDDKDPDQNVMRKNLENFLNKS